jgi:hypothetical protein
VNAHAVAPWWELLKDVLIPVAAILVPTLIAIWLARRERLAADEARKEDRRLDAEAREDERRLREQESRENLRQAGAARALEIMELLSWVALERDEDRRVEHLKPMRLLLLDMTLKLQPHHAAVDRWAFADLNAVLQVLHVRDEDGRAVHLDEIRDRHATFSWRITQWRLGQVDDAWFEGRQVSPLGGTPT